MTDVTDPKSTAWMAQRESVGAHLFAETVQFRREATVSVRGELDIASASALRTRLFDILCLSIDSLTLDLAELDFIDSSGVHVLDDVRKETAKREVRFVLVSTPECVTKVLECTGMDGLFTYG